MPVCMIYIVVRFGGVTTKYKATALLKKIKVYQSTIVRAIAGILMHRWALHDIIQLLNPSPAFGAVEVD